MPDDRTVSSTSDSSPIGRRKMRWAVLVGTLVVVVSLAWLIVDMLLAGYAQWGRGPNIGRGLIIFSCYGLIVAGLVAVAVGGGFRIGTWNLGSWFAAGAVIVLFTGVVVVRIVEPRDEGGGLVGRLGMTASPAGDPVLVFAICRGVIDRVQIHGPNQGTSPNQVLADYRTSTPVRSGSQFDVVHPSGEWAANRSFTSNSLAAQTVVIASATGDKTFLSQVSFSSSDVASLEPGQVLDGSGAFAHRRSMADFLTSECATGG